MKWGILVFLCTAIGGWAYLQQPSVLLRADIDTNSPELIPSLLWATGHGLSFSLDFPEQVFEFFAQQRQSLTPSDIPADIIAVQADGRFIKDRYYLLYTIGILWRLFGINWESVRIFCACYFALSAVLIYGIFRLGMNPFFSLAGTLFAMFSPVMLSQIAWIRSMGKVPFILASILLVGYLIKCKVRPRTLVLLACIGGFTAGTGFGFRQDVIITLPPLLAVIFLAARISSAHAFSWRIVCSVLAITAFIIPAWPMLSMTHSTGGNNSLYLSQGFSRPCISDYGMDQGVITPLYHHYDYMVHAIYVDYFNKQNIIQHDDFTSMRTISSLHLFTSFFVNPSASISDIFLTTFFLNENTPDINLTKIELATRNQYKNMLQLFPGDFIGRILAVTSRIVRNLQPVNSFSVSNPPYLFLKTIQEPIVAHINHFGLFYLLGTFLIVSAFSVRLAFCFLTLLLYFAGYTSLQFQFRHAFHLNFFSIWFPLFLFSLLAGFMMHVYREKNVRYLKEHFSIENGKQLLTRWSVFFLLSFTVFCMPLYLARMYQHSRVAELVNVYKNAELEPLEASVSEMNGLPYYTPAHLPAFESSAYEKLCEITGLKSLGIHSEPLLKTEYLVAEVESTTDTAGISWGYKGLNEDGNNVYVFPNPTNHNTVRFFIPVYQYSESFKAKYQQPQGDFKGITLAPGCTLKQIYRVKNITDFPFLYIASLPSDNQQIRWYQQFKW